MSDPARERVRRIGLNEAVFRAVNEQIDRLAERFGLTDDALDLVCECGDAECADRIRMKHSDYERLRSDATTFAVVPGHEVPDVEEVVERGKGYDVVRKRSGEPALIAERTDNRS